MPIQGGQPQTIAHQAHRPDSPTALSPSSAARPTLPRPASWGGGGPGDRRHSLNHRTPPKPSPPAPRPRLVGPELVTPGEKAGNTVTTGGTPRGTDHPGIPLA